MFRHDPYIHRTVVVAMIDIKLKLSDFRDMGKKADAHRESGGVLCWNGDVEAPVTIAGIRGGENKRVVFYPILDAFTCYDRGSVPIGTVHTHGRKTVYTIGGRNRFLDDTEDDTRTTFSGRDLADALESSHYGMSNLVSCLVGKGGACLTVKSYDKADEPHDFLYNFWDRVDQATRAEGKSPQFSVAVTDEDGEITWRLGAEEVASRLENRVHAIFRERFRPTTFRLRRLRAPRIQLAVADVCRALGEYREGERTQEMVDDLVEGNRVADVWKIAHAAEGALRRFGRCPPYSHIKTNQNPRDV